MLSQFFHSWERRLADVSKDRVVRPFEWGLDWIQGNGHPSDVQALDRAERYVESALADTQAWFTAPLCEVLPRRSPGRRHVVGDVSDGALDAASGKQHRLDALLSWPAECVKRSASGCTRPAAMERRSAGPCRTLSTARPIRDERASPQPALSRRAKAAGARARRLHRQLERDSHAGGLPAGRARRAARDQWLAREGYERIGILGTSLGSCLSMLTTCHEPLVRAQALNHISPYFADVVWRGLSTRHVRAGLNGHITLDQLRQLWMPISPQFHLDRLTGREDAAGLRAVRSDVSRRSLAPSGGRIQGQVRAIPAQRPSVRPLQHGIGAVQISRWCGPDEISVQQSSVVGS